MQNGKSSGFLKLILIFIIGIAVLAYFKVDVKGFIESPRVSYAISYTGDVLVYIWDNFLKTPTLYFWNDILVPAIRSINDSGVSTTTPK